MITSSYWAAGLVLFSVVPFAQLAPAQDKATTASSPSSNFSVECPEDSDGIFVQNSGWLALSSEFPIKTRTKRALAASLTYGAVRGAVIAEYSGQHAKLRLETRRPVICICHVVPIPVTPVIVRLHPKKDSRELDGGKLPVMGAKIAEAKQSDLVPTEVVQPENDYWLVRATEDLPAGEYALMLGTQNLSIFTFTIVNPPGENRAPAPRKP
jgi:hypothetical protein